jgi:hypothetical protein
MVHIGIDETLSKSSQYLEPEKPNLQTTGNEVLIAMGIGILKIGLLESISDPQLSDTYPTVATPC